MELRAGYKNTAIGVIPLEWKTEELGNILKFGNGRDYKHLKVGNIPVLGTGGLMTYVNDYLYDGESVGIGRKGTIDKPQLLNNKFWTVDTLFYTHSFNRCIPKFIFYKFCLIPWKNYNEASGVPSLNKNNLEKIQIPLPPLPEQTAIATVLSDTDNLLQAIEKKIAKKRLIKKGAMQELLKPKEGWVVKRIEEVVRISTGSKNTQDKRKNGKYPFYVRSQTVERINSYSYDCEAVLTAGDGVGTGKVFHYVNHKFELHQRVYIMNEFSEELDGYYFYLFFSTNFNNRIMQMTAKSSVDSVRREMIANMLIPIPSRDEQTKIATILSDMNTEIESLEKQLEKYEQVKQGVMQNLLTGKIRLV